MTKDTKGVRQVLEELANTVFRHGQARRTNTPFHYGEPVKEAETTLQEIMLGMKPKDMEVDPIQDFDYRYCQGFNACNELIEQNIRGGFNNG